MKPSLMMAAALAAALPVVMAAGCGESQQVTVFKQGQYQGKPDKEPWDNAQFKGDRAAWDRAINARTAAQNEYVRIGG
ncbi:MAG TPA: hypothetical protein VD839_05660 [Burkholderiales bacterium]|jgi:hypothetical protein|nr:hypothetical protein [Burkholderiales bacterium]